MKTNIKEIEDLLWRAGYRKHGRMYRKQIDGNGLPLSSREQEINERGGFDYGTDAAEVLRCRVADLKIYLARFDRDEVESDEKLSWLDEFLRESETALS